MFPNLTSKSSPKRLLGSVLFLGLWSALTLFIPPQIRAQIKIDHQSPLFDSFGSIVISGAEGWKVSPEAPNGIPEETTKLTQSVSVSTLHIDTLRNVLGTQPYGWAELSFYADQSTSTQLWLIRNYGVASIRVWMNGILIFTDGKPSKRKEDEEPKPLKPIHFAPFPIQEGLNYVLIEFSFHSIPHWLNTIQTSPKKYVAPLISTVTDVTSYQQTEQKRAFILGSVSFVLFLLALAHGYLHLKSVHKYHYYAFWTNTYLLFHSISQMGDYTFQWSIHMQPVRELGHVLFFLGVFYNIIFTIGHYFKLTLPIKSIRFIFGMYIFLSIYAVLFHYALLYVLHPLLAVLNLGFALYLLKQSLKKTQGIRVAILFSGFLIMLLGAFIYAVIYQLYFPKSVLVYYASTIMVYMGIPISFTITIALNFVDIFDDMEQKVVERTKELEQKDEFKSRFFLNVSHELRTPITILEGLLEKAWNRSETSEELHIPKEDSTLILRNARRLAGLVNQILDLSKSDKGALTLQKKHVRLDALIQNVVELNQAFVALRHQRIEFESSTRFTILTIDMDKISTVLTNVVINASKYGPEYSRILIESRLNEDENKIEIDVTDEGDGVAEEDRERIFERFHRIEASDKPYVEGLGIGLELSRTLARLHGGDLTIVESEGTGARFRLHLPYDRSLALEPIDEWPSSPERTDGQGQTHHTSTSSPSTIELLLVEDNPDMNAYIKGLLMDIATVHSCKNGAEALSFLENHTVDLVITDLMMPTLTGEELIQHMASDPTLSSIPVVVVSAKDQLDHRLQLLRVGIIDYISKPFNSSELTLKIENLLRFYEHRKSFALEIPEEVIYEEDSLSEKLKNYILEHIDDTRLTASFLADVFAMSERSFYRKIEKDSGLTPAAFLREVRLQYAARLVEQSSELRLNELAYKVGYKSVETFKKNYITRFGRSPI